MQCITLRPESSVAVGFNEDGEMVFPCERHGPMIHRTPAEVLAARAEAPAAQSRPRDIRPDSHYVERPYKRLRFDRPRFNN